jgi:glutaconate CoA-transferase subunit A
MRLPVLALDDAVRTYVHDGDAAYLGNFGSQLFAVGHELIRQQRRDLDLIIGSGGILLDQLIGAGVAASATFGHCWSPVGPFAAYNFRRLAESGRSPVAFHEVSLGMFTAALTAGAWGVPFMPFPGLEGTGFLTEDWSRGRVENVTTGFGSSNVVRAIAPDIAFVHADRCDPDGNAWINGPISEVPVAAAASRAAVLVVEQLTDAADLRAHGVTLPGHLFDAIVVHPGAVAPDGAAGRYGRDVDAYVDYAEHSKTAEGFVQWLDGVKGARR